jgi:DNA (cytosine-5)-methyltransferase 1
MEESIKPTVGSLFSGIGGFELGFEWAGFQTEWQVEINEYARRVLAKHWPNVERHTDVREVGKHNLKTVDVLIGGFPCQDISTAGKGVGIEGGRSGLWSEYARIIGELRPKYAVMENVAALVYRGLGRVLGDLAEIGYDAEWQVLSAAAFGAPHQRERIFIVGYPHDDGLDGPQVGVGSVQGSYRNSERAHQLVELARPSRQGQGNDGGGGNGKCSNVAYTSRIYAQGHSRRQGKVQLRRSSWWEAEPLMGGSHDGVSRELDGSDGHKAPWERGIERTVTDLPYRVERLIGLGNAIVPQVAQYIGELVMADIKRRNQ